MTKRGKVVKNRISRFRKVNIFVKLKVNICLAVLTKRVKYSPLWTMVILFQLISRTSLCVRTNKIYPVREDTLVKPLRSG